MLLKNELHIFAVEMLFDYLSISFRIDFIKTISFILFIVATPVISSIAFNLGIMI